MKLFSRPQNKTRRAERAPSESKAPAAPAVPGRAGSLIRSPILSEKATMLSAQENAYVFLVSSRANKSEIKKEIERIFGVDVASVRTITQKPKRRFWRGREGFRSGHKKAIVTVKDGKKIEVLPH